METIQIEIRLYSILKQYGQQSGLGDKFPLAVEKGVSLDQIREKIGIPNGRVGSFVKAGRTLQPTDMPADGDVIDVLPPTISGG